MKAHYDAHAKSTTRRERAQGPLFELKQFHNAQKRDLIVKYGHCASLLDLGCGRGGDIGKWTDAGIRYATGLDISGEELDEARRRLRGMRRSGAYEFQQADLREGAWISSRIKYGAITSMFSLHYFFDTETSLRNVLSTVQRNIKPGGYFFGTVPDGKRITELLAIAKGKYQDEHLTLEPMYDPENRDVFGKAYVFALNDTVTSDARGTAGSLEYLVNMNYLKMVAAEHDLEFVESIPFAPPTEFAGATASRLFTTFVFRNQS